MECIEFINNSQAGLTSASGGATLHYTVYLIGIVPIRYIRYSVHFHLHCYL